MGPPLGGAIQPLAFRCRIGLARGLRVVHRVDQLAPQQRQRRTPIQHDVMEWVRDDLRGPDQTRGHVADEKQVDRPEHETSDADVQPHDPQAPDETLLGGLRVQQAQKLRAEVEDHRSQGPEGH